jgi:predicted metal-dependent hydrolase
MTAVQLPLPWKTRTPAGSQALTIGTHTYELHIARHRRARRYVLRVTADGALRLTVPIRSSIEGGVTFARRQETWIERERVRQLARSAPWRAGTTILFRGEGVTLTMADGVVMCGSERIVVRRAHDDLRPVVEAHLLATAARELPPRLAELATPLSLSVARVAVRNQRSRWGACSAKGTITLNWRLIQMPPPVSDYVILHELMHLKQLNHSRRFWRAVADACPHWRDAERWIRRHGREIL